MLCQTLILKSVPFSLQGNGTFIGQGSRFGEGALVGYADFAGTGMLSAHAWKHKILPSQPSHPPRKACHL